MNENFKCNECGWLFPEDLVENFLKEQQIFCERCGSIINKEDYPIQELRQKRKQQTAQPSLFNVLKKKTSAITKKLRTQLKEAMEKQEEKSNSG